MNHRIFASDIDANRLVRPAHLMCFSAIASILVLIAVIINLTSTLSEAYDNLGSIGNGKPVVVLVNEGDCVGCNEVTQRALAALDGLADVEFRVADTCTRAGKLFSDTYHTTAVSVLLFDAEGINTRTVKGLQSVSAYQALFHRWLEESCLEKREAASPAETKPNGLLST